MGPPPVFTRPVYDREYGRVSRRYRDDLGRIDPFVDEEDDNSEWPDVDLGGFPRGLSLVKICLRIVWKDREILLYQASSAIICLGLFFAYLAALFPINDLELMEQELDSPAFYLKLFPYYVVAFFVNTFFKAATIAVATIRMEGGNPVFADGLDASSRRIHRLLGWAVIEAVVGVVLAFVQSRSRGGRVAATIANMAWGIATYFVVPVLLFENSGPFSAIGRSARIVRRTWKEALAGNFGMGAVFFGLFLLGLFFSLFAYGLTGFVGMFIFIIAYVSVLTVFSSAAHGVLLAALYRLARTGKAPEEIESYEPLVRNVSRFARPSDAEYVRSSDNTRSLLILKRM